MSPKNQEDKEKTAVLIPEAGSCYGHSWKQMKKYFFELLLIVIVSFLLSLPMWGLGSTDRITDAPFFFFIFLFSLAYAVLVGWPVEYGVSYAFLKAARGEKLEIADMFYSFKNYGNVILANLLTGVIIGFGFFFFFVPGIIFACKLAFVPYLVVDRKLDAVEAVKESWRMTTGYAFNIFLIGFLAIFVAIAGLICLFVGIIIAAIWIELAVATMYHAVCQSESEYKK